MRELEFNRTDAVIHDIRNLLQVISTNGDLLALTSCEQRGEWANQITEAVKAVSHLLNQIDPACDHRSPAAACSSASVLRSVQMILHATNPAVVVFLEPGEEVSVPIPPLEFLRAVVNLARNGAEAAEANAARRPTVHIGVTRTDGSVSVNVSDSGSGFQLPFSLACRMEYSTRKSQRQRGYGLGIVKAIAESYGGYIAASRFQQRTLVRLCLPAAANVAG